MVGVGDGEMFFASAIPAFMAHTRTVVVLEDGDIVTLRADGAEFTDVAGDPLVRETVEISWDADAAEKGGFETFMLKEIHEQPAALRDTLAGRLHEDGMRRPLRGRASATSSCAACGASSSSPAAPRTTPASS